MLMLLWWWSTVLLIFSIHGNQAQQSYVDNKQLDECDINDTSHATTFGYTCNAAPTCLSYLTFRSQPPRYNTPSSIASLLHTDPNHIIAINDFASTSTTIPDNTLVVVPISNCSCSARGFYQYNASYKLKDDSENYFTMANNTYEGLTTCQALNSQNNYNYNELQVGYNITIPLRCACPTANQTAAGIKYLLTYLITWGDTYEAIAASFGVLDVQTIFDANELSEDDLIYPFTPILIPLKTEPKQINTSIIPPPPPPPAPPVIIVEN